MSAFNARTTKWIEKTSQSKLDIQLGEDKRMGAEDEWRFKAYIASPLTNVTTDTKRNIAEIVEIIRDACAKCGIRAYVPQDYTDPERNPDLDASVVYMTDSQKVHESNLVIVIIDNPSHGVGMEVEIASRALIPVLFISQRGAISSRMLTGVPGRKIHLQYENKDELSHEISNSITLLLPAIEKNLEMRKETFEVGPNIKSLREEAKISLDTLSIKSGIDRQVLERIESESDQASNLSFIQIRQLAIALNSDPGLILSPSYLDTQAEKIIDILMSEAVVGMRTKGGNGPHDVTKADLIKLVNRLIRKKL